MCEIYEWILIAIAIGFGAWLAFGPRGGNMSADKGIRVESQGRNLITFELYAGNARLWVDLDYQESERVAEALLAAIRGPVKLHVEIDDG
jgi:hypothetical protein